MAYKKKTTNKTRKSRFSKTYTYSVVPGAKYISYTDGTKMNRNGSMKTTGYIPNTKANRDKLNASHGKPEDFGDRLIWW